MEATAPNRVELGLGRCLLKGSSRAWLLLHGTLFPFSQPVNLRPFPGREWGLTKSSGPRSAGLAHTVNPAAEATGISWG